MIQQQTPSQPIFALGLDARLDFCREVIGSGDVPTAVERAEAAALKLVVFDALAQAIEAGVPKSNVLLWSDHDLGEGVLLRGRAMSLPVAVAGDTPGAGALDRHDSSSPTGAWGAVTKLDAPFAAVRLEYNFADPVPFKARLQEQVRSLMLRCQEAGRRLIIDLTPHATPSQLEQSGNARASGRGH
jgi:hypothetical protein